MHVLITGASRGIGHAIARRFAAKPDVRLSLLARNRERLEALAASLEAPAHVVAVDLTDPERALCALDEAQAALGPVDVLVNNAGMHTGGRTHTVAPETAQRLLALNVHTPMRLVQAVLPAMLERRSGTIVDVASVAAFTPLPSTYHYNASKAALAAASESLRGELRHSGVHVVTVYPGPIHTDMGHEAERLMGGGLATRLVVWGSPEGLARRIERAVRRRRPRVIYPWIYTLSRHLPGLTYWALARFGPIAEAPPPPTGAAAC